MSDWTDWLTDSLWPHGLQYARLPIFHYLPEFAQTPVHCVDDVIQPSYPLTPAFLLLPSNFPSIQVFSNKPGLQIRWPKYWSFSFSIRASNEYSGLISFRIDWFDLLVVQKTLKHLLQHYSLKASILGCSAFFTVKLSHPYMTTGKTTVLTIKTFVGKVMSLLFNAFFRFVIAFLPRSKQLLISWLQSSSAMILEPKKIKFVTFFPIHLPWRVGTGCNYLRFLNVEF